MRAIGWAVTDIQTTVAFKSLTAQTSAVLLTRGMEVEPTAVQGVLAHVVTVTAERTGLDEEALHLVIPETVADLIAQTPPTNDSTAPRTYTPSARSVPTRAPSPPTSAPSAAW